MCQGIPVAVTPEDGTFLPTLQDIEQAASQYTKAIIINSPNNPSGVMYPAEFICEVVEFCEHKGIFLVMDDIYHKLVFDGKRPAPGYRFSNKNIEATHIIVVNGVSKLYGMTGFRIGWVIAPRRMVQVMTNIQAQTTSCVPAVLQAAAEGALRGVQSGVESLRLNMQNNRDILMQELKTFHGLRITKPDGTFYALPDFRAYRNNSVELSEFLLRKALVVTVPGKEFGMEGFLRLSYAGTVKDITQGIERIKWALDPTSPNEIYIGDRKLVRDWL
jgi:aspartate aminotransferase